MDPWSKGGYSRHIREAIMMVEKLPEVNPPSGWLAGQVRQAVPILESPRRRNRGGDRKKKRLPRVNIGQRGAPRGGRVRWPPGRGVAPLWPSFGTPKASAML